MVKRLVVEYHTALLVSNRVHFNSVRRQEFPSNAATGGPGLLFEHPGQIESLG